MSSTDPSYFGDTTFGKPEPVELPFPDDSKRKIAIICAHGQWRPPDRLASFLPEEFSIPLDCYTGSDGLRRILPGCNVEELIDMGAVGGLAVLHGIRGFDRDLDYSYRAMLLIHQHVRGRAYRGQRGMREHLNREFQYSRDLFIRRPGRMVAGERNVIPEDLKSTIRAARPCRSIKGLMELGRQAALEAGYSNPTSKHAIAFALYEAARGDPFDVKAETVSTLVRLALFDAPLSDEPPPELVDIVLVRLLEALEGHLDDSADSFQWWFSGPSNSLVKQIAQQRSQRGGRLDRGQVRQALLCLGWQSYEYVGHCVHALMRTIKNSVPEPLTDQERRLYEQMFESQPYYGNLPAAMLAERMGLLRRAVLAIWDEPGNPEHVRVLHRLLWCYADMVRTRRTADRQSKQRSEKGSQKSSPKAHADDDGAGAAGGSVSQEDRPIQRSSVRGQVHFDEHLHSPHSPATREFAEVGYHIRQLHGIECPAGCTCWEYKRQGEDMKTISIRLRCECGQVDQVVCLSFDEFRKRAKEVLKR